MVTFQNNGLPLAEYMVQLCDEKCEGVQSSADDGNDLVQNMLVYIPHSLGKGTHIDRSRLWFQTPDADANPSRCHSPYDISAKYYNSQPNQVSAQKDSKYGPNMPCIVASIWDRWVMDVTKHDAGNSESEPIFRNTSSRTYNRFNGKRSINGRIKKNRSGAWMRAVSNGLDETGG